ncbi:hypothetical protein [Leifsonia xyli]|uniref:hypothetical protein n=1 Tax=Leifsonia xyli TaxID=1575 RepID=UPI003D668F48
MAAIAGGAVAFLLSVGSLSGVAGSNRSAPAAIGQVLVLVVAASVAAALPMFLTAVSVPTVVAALAAWWLWGTVVWWEPALFDGAYTPSDKPVRRPSAAPSSEMRHDATA